MYPRNLKLLSNKKVMIIILDTARLIFSFSNYRIIIICEKYYDEYAHLDPLYFSQGELSCWTGRRIRRKIDERFEDAGEFEKFLKSF